MKKQITPAPELIAAAKSVLEARAIVANLRPIVEKIQSAVLAEIEAHDEYGEPITSANDSWKICEEQAAAFYSALDTAYLKDGFCIPAGHCPLLVAEQMEREAVREMLQTAEPFWKSGGADLTYDRLCNHFTIYKEVAETTLKFLAQFIK